MNWSTWNTPCASNFLGRDTHFYVVCSLMDDPSVGHQQSPRRFWIQKTKTYILSKFWFPKATLNISKVSVVSSLPNLKQNVVQTYLLFHASNFLGTSKLQVEWKSLNMHYSMATCYNPIPSRKGFSRLLYQHLAIEVNTSDSSASISFQKLLYSTVYCLWPLVYKVITLCILETHC